VWRLGSARAGGQDNGALVYYEGSHRGRIYQMYDLGRRGTHGVSTPQSEHYGHYERFVESWIDTQEYPRRVLALEKGQAIIWAANLFHGGGRIRDRSRTRYSQVTHYFFHDCMYYLPFYSDPYIGRIRLANVVDIGTRGLLSSTFDGKRIANYRGEGVLGALRQIAYRAYLRTKLRRYR